MAITNGYATLAQYKAWITMRGSEIGVDVADDAVIEAHIEAASRYIDRQTGKRFFADSTDKTRYYTPEDDEIYLLTIDPLSASPTSVSIDYTGIRSYDAITENTDFELLPDNAALEGQPYTQIAIITALSAAYFPSIRRAVKVVGKFGFPAVPDDVQEATLLIAESLNSARAGQTSSGGRVTVTASGVVIQPEAVPRYAESVIEHYRSLV